MSFHSDMIGSALCALVPVTLLLIWAVKGGAAWAHDIMRKLSIRQRIVAVAALCVIVGYGGDKPNPQPPEMVLELLTVLRDGSLTDRSGTVVSGSQAVALDAFAGEAWRIAAALSNVVESARASCVALTNRLAFADYSAAYVSLDMPRGVPADPNHNIMVGFEKVSQTPTNLTAWVWFSELPSTNVDVRVQYSVADGVWAQLASVANSWPATEAINGVDCVRYCYAIPAGIAGTPLRPQYEVEFGGYAAAEYLSVPESGVTVQVGEAEHLPYTGWDTYGDGEDALQVRYVGGIAVEARQAGIEYTGVNL